MIGKKKVSSIPTWDRAEATCPRYIAKIEALSVYQQCEDALDKTEMATCPTKAIYNGINKAKTDNGEKKQLSLYRQNAKLVATIVLGQASDHGLVVVEKTKTTDNSNGFSWKALDAMKKKRKPSNAVAEIVLNNNLDNVKFSSAKKYYNDVIGVTARYDVPVSKTDLIKNLAKRVDNAVYAKLIIDHLNGANKSLDALCTEIDVIQALMKTTNQSGTTRQAGKETALANTDTHTFKGRCGNYNKVGHKHAHCPNPKKGGVGRDGGGRGNGSGRGNGGSNITCNHCGLKCHKEADCWKKNPDKTPSWYKSKEETAGGAVDVKVMLCNLEVDQDTLCDIQDSGLGLNFGLGEGNPTTNVITEIQDFSQARM